MSRIGIVGAGVIGAGWAARFVLHGHHVAVFEPNDATFNNLGTIIERAASSYEALGIGASVRGSVSRVGSIADAAVGSVHIQESVPEVLELKQKGDVTLVR